MLILQPYKAASITHYISIENDKRLHKGIQTDFKLHVFYEYLLISITNFGDQTLSYYYLNPLTNDSHRTIDPRTCRCFVNVTKRIIRLSHSSNDGVSIDITKVYFRYCLFCFFLSCLYTVFYFSYCTNILQL